jgi:O-antigen/teichoic acid export membrane protein
MNPSLEDTSVSSGAILMVFSKAVSHFCYLLVAVILARALEPAEFGSFNQVWLVNKTLVVLFALGLPVSIYYFLPRLKEDRIKGFVLQTMLGVAILAIPFSAAMYLFAGRLALYFDNPALAGYLRLFAVFPLVTMPTLATDSILIALGRTSMAGLFEVVTKLAMILCVAGTVALGGRLGSVLQALIAYGVAQSLLGVWMIGRATRGMTLRFSFGEWKAQLAFAVPLGFSAWAGVLNYQVDKVLVALFHSPTMFAKYAAGAFEIPLAGVTSVPVWSVTMSQFSKRFSAGDRRGFLSLWHQSMLKLALVIFGVAAFLMVFAEPAMMILFGTEYIASAQPFRIYLLFLPLRITLLDQVLASLGETRFVLKSQLASLALNLFLGYVLVRYAGWIGPAISSVLANYLNLALLLFAIRKGLQVSFQALIPWRALGQVALVAFIAAAGSLPFAFLEVANPWKMAGGFVIFSIIYLFGNLQNNCITASDLQALRTWQFFRPKSAGTN